MFLSLVTLPLIYSAAVAAQSLPTVVCVAGQCLQGFTNTTLGATLSKPGSQSSILLLPGQYTQSTGPKALNDVLTSSSASLSTSPGFSTNSSAFSLPLDLELQPGIVTYPQVNYSGAATFTALPSSGSLNSSTQTSANGLAISSNVWAAVSFGGSSNRVILWDSAPDLSQLPTGTASSTLSLLDIQSSACSPPCAGSGVCSVSGTCSCPQGFNGTSCESCSSGFFGPTCQACPAGCQSCDDGIAGSGRCLSTTVSNPPSSCNCLNGECGSDGQCTCNAGWTTGTNGTACAKCAQGFFLDSNGDCSICQLGCTQCADSSGDCIACASGFTQSANDATKCLPNQSITSSGTPCPDGSFSNGTACAVCSPECQTCTGPDSTDCVICGEGKYSLNGNCVSADGSGVCQSSNLVADNNKHECTGCPAKCTKCGIPSFNVASTIDQVQCTGCLPGFVLSQGQCVESCPSGTFLNPQDNLTCTACDSSCGSCVGSATFCLTCANNQLASGGKCVSSCPSNTFSSSGSCIPCHPDCATCSGSSFNQCSSCASSRPVLTNGRCLETCSKSQFFDTTSSTCQSCDSSCSSCSGAGPSKCLACSSASQILRAGTCVSASCTGNSSVVAGLGLCLSDLVEVPSASGTNSLPPLPSITGIDTPVAPVVNTSSSSGSSLAWWQILLMALGCAFIFVGFLYCWRRRARKRRAQQTKAFATAKRLAVGGGWRHRLVRFGERLFGHKSQGRWMVPEEPYAEDIKLAQLRAAEEARHDRDLKKHVDSYEHSRAGSSRQPSPLPSLRDYPYTHPSDAARQANRLSAASLTADSLYSQVTGLPRRGPDARQPVKNAADLLPSRFSGTTHSSAQSYRGMPNAANTPTPAQEYARSVAQAQQQEPQGTYWMQPQDEPRGTYWLQPTNTGNTRNPFRR